MTLADLDPAATGTPGPPRGLRTAFIISADETAWSQQADALRSAYPRLLTLMPRSMNTPPVDLAHAVAADLIAISGADLVVMGPDLIDARSQLLFVAALNEVGGKRFGVNAFALADLLPGGPIHAESVADQAAVVEAGMPLPQR